MRLSSLSRSKTFQVPGQVQEREPDQHSSTISLWIAHYRPTSVMKPCAMNLRNVIRCYPESFLLTASRLSSGFLPAKSANGRHS